MGENNNKGKSGEMILLNIISSACNLRDKLEVTRPSKTNSADLGLDMSLSGPKKRLKYSYKMPFRKESNQSTLKT